MGYSNIKVTFDTYAHRIPGQFSNEIDDLDLQPDATTAKSKMKSAKKINGYDSGFLLTHKHIFSMLFFEKSNALSHAQSYSGLELRTKWEGNEKTVYGACNEFQS
jgi:hypothetical protein